MCWIRYYCPYKESVLECGDVLYISRGFSSLHCLFPRTNTTTYSHYTTTSPFWSIKTTISIACCWQFTSLITKSCVTTPALMNFKVMSSSAVHDRTNITSAFWKNSLCLGTNLLSVLCYYSSISALSSVSVMVLLNTTYQEATAASQ